MDQILKFFSSNENGTYNKNHKYGYSRYKTSPKMYRIVVFNILDFQIKKKKFNEKKNCCLKISSTVQTVSFLKSLNAVSTWNLGFFNVA